MNRPQAAESVRTAHPTALLISATIIYYVLDLVKDLYLYGRFGPGQLDAFYGSYTILEAALRAMMFMALGAAMMPVLAEGVREGGEDLAERYGSAVLLLWVPLLLAVAGAGVLFAPEIMSIYGFARTPGAVAIARLVFAGLPLFGIDKVLRTLLERRQQFGVPVAASLVLRVAFLLVVFVFASRWGAVSAGAGSFVSLAAAAVFVVGGFYAAGARFRRPLGLGHALVRRTLVLLVPLGIAGVFTQTELVNCIFASHFDKGSLSLLRLARVVYEIPVTLFCVSVGTAVFPRMCEAAAAGDRAALEGHLARALRRAGYFVLPAMFGLMALAYPLIRTVYRRGQFTEHDAGLAAGALVAYSLGLVAWGARPVLDRALYAAGKHKWFIPIEVLTLALTGGLNYLFGIVLGWGIQGLALGTALAVTAALGARCVLVWRFVCVGRMNGLRAGLVKMAGAAAGMGIVCYAIWHVMALPPGVPAALGLAAVIVLGAGLYFASTRLLRLEEFDHLRELFDKFVRRRRGETRAQ